MDFHKETINKLVNRLKKGGKYQYAFKNITYTLSEMDVVAYRERGKRNYLLVFEVKSSDKHKYYKKARWQLNTHQKAFGDTVNKLFKFYVIPKYTSKKDYQVRWIK